MGNSARTDKNWEDGIRKFQMFEIDIALNRGFIERVT